MLAGLCGYPSSQRLHSESWHSCFHIFHQLLLLATYVPIVRGFSCAPWNDRQRRSCTCELNLLEVDDQPSQSSRATLSGMLPSLTLPSRASPYADPVVIVFGADPAQCTCR